MDPDRLVLGPTLAGCLYEPPNRNAVIFPSLSVWCIYYARHTAPFWLVVRRIYLLHTLLRDEVFFDSHVSGFRVTATTENARPDKTSIDCLPFVSRIFEEETYVLT